MKSARFFKGGRPEITRKFAQIWLILYIQNLDEFYSYRMKHFQDQE